jgi:NADPH2:quinone reductase
MTQAIRIHRTGGPDVLQWEEHPLPAPEAGEIRVRHRAVGVNYIDIYHRTGAYPLPLPSGIGVEGAGVVEAVGEGVAHFAPGDRVVYAGGPPGAYATERLLPAARAVKLPDTISDETAAALFFKGLTAEYLVRRCHAVKPGEVVLLHAAAGGVGTLMSQWLRHLGATTIGTVSSEAKAQHARAHGCTHTIDYRREDIVARVREITGGRGVDVVYDSVGRDTFSASLQCLRTRGLLVSFGIASGPVPPLDVAELGARGGLFVTRPSIAHYTATREELDGGARALFGALASGVLQAEPPAIHPLRDVARVHAELEGGKTVGAIVLVP